MESEYTIHIREPNFLRRYWQWNVFGPGPGMSGKASSEPEAWRLALDAEKFLIKQNKEGHNEYITNTMER